MAFQTVVIGGGTGFIGVALAKLLKNVGYRVVIISRKPGADVITWSELGSKGLPDDCVAVFSLAGQNVLDPTRRWTPGFKQNVYASRINTTKALAGAITKMKMPPKVFVSISGVGYYKPDPVAEYTEESEGGNHDFLAELCKKWEEAGQLPSSLNTRRVIVRSGVVLGHNGGMIKQLFWPFFFGLGGPVASGQQYLPWIHIKDLTGILLHTINNEKVTGILNGVSPHIITNAEFSKAFASAMRRPAFIPMPTFALNVAFGAERAVMLTEGQKVIPKRTLESGYKYQFEDIRHACKSCARFPWAKD